MDTTNTTLNTGSSGFTYDRGLVKSNTKIHGQNAAHLISKIIRERILDSVYYKLNCQSLGLLDWMEECARSCVLVGVYENETKTKPTKFMCLLFRLIHLEPDNEIVEYLIRGTHSFKYLRALGCLYYRMARESDAEIYNTLESQLGNYAKLRVVDGLGKESIVHFDEFVDALLNDSRVYDLTLPKLVPRVALEESGIIEPRESSLMDEFDDIIDKEEEQEHTR